MKNKSREKQNMNNMNKSNEKQSSKNKNNCK